MFFEVRLEGSNKFLDLLRRLKDEFAALGLIPILWFNLNNQLSSASFYLVERHPWEFQAAGLLHAFEQAGLVTPPLYFCLILTLFRLYRGAKLGQRSDALLFSFAITNLSVYLVLAPWADATSTSIHWPLSGYFPLLVVLPATLKDSFLTTCIFSTDRGYSIGKDGKKSESP